MRLLDKIRRFGKYIDEEAEQEIKNMMKPLSNLPDGIVPTKLFCTNVDV